MRVELVELNRDSAVDRLREQWRSLEDRSAPPFFRSWAWIGTWIATLPADRERWALTIDLDGVTIAAGVLATGWRRSLLIAPTQVAALNDSPAESEQRLAIEYNGLLCDPAITADPVMWSALWNEIWRALRAKGIETLVLSGIEPGSFSLPAGAISWSIGAKPAPRVDLRAAREKGFTAVDLLGGNGREQLRRAERGYAQLGPLALERAATLDQAQVWMDRLTRLHQQTWTARGKTGAFGDPFFLRFHHRLLNDCFGSGQIEILRATAGEAEIGYLHHFRSRDSALAYQSGFDYPADPRLKPGLVSHALAINAALSDPTLAIYDFLAGDSRFKRGFSNAEVTLDWIAVSRRYGLAHLDHVLRRTASRWIT